MRRHAAEELGKIAAEAKVTAEVVENVCRRIRGLPAIDVAATSAPAQAQAAPVTTAAVEPPPGLATKPPVIAHGKHLRETVEMTTAWAAAMRDMIGTPDNVEVAEALKRLEADLDTVKEHYFEKRYRQRA
jgi:hypothetical protein